MNSSERELYLLHSRTPGHQKKLRRTKEIILEALDKMKKPFVSVSWGKDSIVVAHLVWMEQRSVPMVWSDRGPEAELPETYPLVEEWKRRYNINLAVVVPEMTMFELYRKYGIPEISGGKTRAIIKEINLVRAIGNYARENGFDGRFMGIRADESKGRRKLGKFRGPLFFGETERMWICNPIIYWSARDVWAYIFANDLPYHPLYDHNKLRDREQTRLSNWSGVFDYQHGRLVELKMNYPDLFEWLVREFPEVKNYV